MTTYDFFLAWLDNWQTLLGSAIAIPFAALAVWISIHQEGTRRRRTLDARRATLPIRLSLVSDYAATVIDLLSTAMLQRLLRDSAEQGRLSGFQKPPLPESLIFEIEKTIEAIPVRRVTVRLTNIIGEIQILNSRMNLIASENHARSYYDTLLMQAATIYAQAESLYEYARRETQKPPKHLEWSSVLGALRKGGVYEQFHPDTYAFIRRREAKGFDVEGDYRRVPSISQRYGSLKKWAAERVKTKMSVT
jgi:hypothetical protein